MKILEYIAEDEEARRASTSLWLSTTAASPSRTHRTCSGPQYRQGSRISAPGQRKRSAYSLQRNEYKIVAWISIPLHRQTRMPQHAPNDTLAPRGVRCNHGIDNKRLTQCDRWAIKSGKLLRGRYYKVDATIRFIARLGNQTNGL